MAMRRSYNLRTICKAEVIEHQFPPEMGVDLTCANTNVFFMILRDCFVSENAINLSSTSSQNRTPCLY